MRKKLETCAILRPKRVNVTDISGGCGSFFKVEVLAEIFTGKSLVQQHRMVNEALRSEIKHIHGLTIVTSAKE